MISSADVREVARGMPNARLVVIENASHDAMGHPEVMRQTIELFRGPE